MYTRFFYDSILFVISQNYLFLYEFLKVNYNKNYTIKKQSTQTLFIVVLYFVYEH